MVFEPEEMYNDISEVFSPPRVVTIAQRSGLRGGWSIDKIVEKEPGVKWDLTVKSHQDEVLKLIKATEPGLIVGSPPCSWYSRMMQLNWPKISNRRKKHMLREAKTLLDFAVECYKLQVEGNRVFIHEHPQTAQS